ncbi:MAG: FAD-dependent oxidoreductase, partial [Spirochaeta sp.]|nr:FAD-dependent oxidoreductase [Spirochaeta sp.]
ATRQMMCCAVTGQGAGVAAALSVRDDVTCREVAIAKVQKALQKQGVRIE